ncbi:RHS repeat-associated core domain-containing protein [Vreelandella sp. GE22]
MNLGIDLEPDALHREIRRRLTLRGAQIGGGQHGDQAHRYALDAAGNRLDGQQALTDNRLDHLDGARHRFDGAGNMIEKQAANGDRLTLGYDGANRLVRLTRASERGRTVEATYRYDGLGRRISKTVRHENGTTATTHYGWDGDRIVREESENQHSTIVYEPGSFVPMLRIDDTEQGPQLSAFVTDALGTPMQLVAPNGDTKWQAQPDDWSAVKNVRGSASQPIRFQGQWHDEESGLYYNRHRYYDPQQGRYVSQDPIGLRGGTNLYAYVGNPMGAVDPLGLFGANMHQLDPISAAIQNGHTRPQPKPERVNISKEISQLISGARSAVTQPMCSALSMLGDNEAIVSSSIGSGVALQGAVKASSSGISNILGIGIGAGASVTGSLGQSVNMRAPEERNAVDFRTFISLAGGVGMMGAESSLSSGTDGASVGIKGGPGIGASAVAGGELEYYILDCNK